MIINDLLLLNGKIFLSLYLVFILMWIISMRLDSFYQNIQKKINIILYNDYCGIMKMTRIVLFNYIFFLISFYIFFEIFSYVFDFDVFALDIISSDNDELKEDKSNNNSNFNNIKKVLLKSLHIIGPFLVIIVCGYINYKTPTMSKNLKELIEFFELDDDN